MVTQHEKCQHSWAWHECAPLNFQAPPSQDQNGDTSEPRQKGQRLSGQELQGREAAERALGVGLQVQMQDSLSCSELLWICRKVLGAWPVW